MVMATRRPVAPDEAAAIHFGPRGGAGTARPAAVTGRSRIAVVGDSDFATNSFFHIMGNARLFLNTVNYLAAEENLIGIEPRTYDLPRVNLTNRQMKGTFFLSVILVPFLKYPANPPSVGKPDTIAVRTALYFNPDNGFP